MNRRHVSGWRLDTLGVSGGTCPRRVTRVKHAIRHRLQIPILKLGRIFEKLKPRVGVQDASEDGSEIGVFQVRPRALVRLGAPQHLEDSRVGLGVFSQRGVPMRRVHPFVQIWTQIQIRIQIQFCLIRIWQ